MTLVWTLAAAAPSPPLLCVLALVTAGVGSVLPVSPTEPALLALSAAAPPSLALPIALLATLGHMAGKLVVYAGGRRATRVLSARHQRALEMARPRMAGSRRAQYATVLVSGATGLPPFYGVTVLCGAMGVPLGGYLLAGSAGRAARFAGLVLLPQLLRS
jgi:membrane protein YqaA with SNARE-associated domain